MRAPNPEIMGGLGSDMVQAGARAIQGGRRWVWVLRLAAAAAAAGLLISLPLLNQEFLASKVGAIKKSYMCDLHVCSTGECCKGLAQFRLSLP